MRTRLFTFIACAMLATACGPDIALNVGLKPAGADIFFGRPAASPAPLPVLPPLPTFPTPIIIPIVQPPPPLPELCPKASPLAFPKLEAAIRPPAPPVAATYPFRYKGHITINPGAKNQQTSPVLGYGSRQVTNVTAASDHWTFDVVEKLLTFTQTVTYEVYPDSRGAGILPAGVSPDAGIYLVKMQRGKNVFQPVTPIQLMALPATTGPETLAGTGSDGTTTMQIDSNEANPNSSVIPGRVTVDACGTPLQGWKDLLAGKIVGVAGPGPETDFTLELDFGTQFGGISLSDHTVYSYTNALGQMEVDDITAIISASPKVPKA